MDLMAGEVYQFVLRGLSTGDGTLPDPYLVLNSGSGAVASNDNISPDDVNARIIYTVPANQGGEYTIVASSLIGGGMGSYTLTLSEVSDDCGEGIGTTCTVGFGPDNSATGEIEVDGDTDWFRLIVRTGRIYRFDVKGESSTDGGGTLANPGLTLYNSSGNAILRASNNQGGADNNARYIFRSGHSLIYVEARDDDGAGNGFYTVEVTDVTTGHNVSEPVGQDFPGISGVPTGRVLVGGSVTGKLGSRQDQDVFQVDLEDSTIYQFDLKGSISGDGTLDFPQLYLYSPYSATSIASDLNTIGSIRNAQITYFVPRGKNGAYRLRALATNLGALGTYTMTVAKAPDDCTADTATTCSVAVGGTSTGEIQADGDTDWFRASLTGGRVYRIEVKGDSSTDGGGTLANAGLTLYDASGNAISGASTNGGGADNNSRYFYQAIAAGTIYIEARDNNGVGVGTYTVAVMEVSDDCTSDTATTCSVAVGGTASGEIEADGDTDWFSASLTEGQIYRIDVKGHSSTDDGGDLDNAGLKLYDASGNAISGASNNRGGADNNARYIYQATAAGTIYIEARDDDGAGTGSYTVAVTDVTDQNVSEPPGQDFNNDYPTTLGRILIGGTVTGAVDEDGDLDAFRVVLTAGEEYQIDLKGSETHDGTLSDPYLELITSVAESFVADNDDAPGSLNARITYTVPDGEGGGGHAINAGASGDNTGTYTLSLMRTSSARGSTGDGKKYSGEQEEVVPPPARPRGLTGTVAHNGVFLTWDDPGDESITGYRILRLDRAVHGLGNFQVHVEDTGSAGTVYADQDVSPDTRYVYRIKAINAAGLSPRSEYFNADTPPAPNRPVTGAPTISGRAQVGETLTVDTSGIADADGLSNVFYSYQWLADDGSADADISGARASSYTLADTDEGKTIQVKVSFTDDAGNPERVASQPTETVSPDNTNTPATGAPTISGTARVGETLAADTSGIADQDGLTNATFSYQWVANDGTTDTDIAGATNPTYTLVASDEGKTVRVRVSFTDDAGNDESLTSAATAALAGEPEPPARPVGLTGTVAHDEVSLTWDDPGDESITGYQVLRLDRDLHGLGNFQVHVDDTGSAATSYVDRGVAPETRYVYRIRARNADGLSKRSHYFNATTLPAPNTPATGAPTIIGTAQVGETLTADTSGIEDGDGLDNATFDYQWLADDSEIQGASASSYTLADPDEGKTIQVKVSFTDDAGNPEMVASQPTETVSPDSTNTPATGVPTVSGTARVGETLTADTSGIEDGDGLDNATFTHQWLADGSEIQGATEAGYVLTEAEEGKAVRVRVSFTDDAGNGESLTSAATEAVEAEPELQEPPARPTGLTGTVAHDEVSLAWDDPGDESITGYQVLRLDRDVHGLGNFQVHVDDTGSAATSYVDREVATETRYVYRIKARNADGLSERSHYFGANTPRRRTPRPRVCRPSAGRPRWGRR